MTDGGMMDDKLVCSDYCPDAAQRQEVLNFSTSTQNAKGC